MKSVPWVLAILLLMSAPISAQIGLTGTWQAQSTPPFEVVLRVNGSRLTGRVSQCAFNASAEVFDGVVDDNSLTFKCTSGDGDRTITFTGNRSGDEIAFTWALQVRAGGSRTDISADTAAGPGVFGPSAPARFITKRAPDGRLAAEADRVRGLEFAAAANLVKQDLKGDGMLFLPQAVSRVRAVIVVIGWGLGFSVYDDPAWRRLADTLEVGILRAHVSYISEPNASLIGAGRMPAQGSADSIVMLLQRLAEDSGHQELTSAPLLFWGHSAAGGQVTNLAALLSQRTVAFVRYHSGVLPDVAPGVAVALLGATTDRSLLSQMPALILVGGKDGGDQGERRWKTSETDWRNRRSAGAPWTFAVEPDATHGDPKDLSKANDLVIPWIAAVLGRRLSPDGATLRIVTEGSGWMGNNRTGEAAPYGTFPGSKAEASWLPDEPSARGWRIVIGATK